MDAWTFIVELSEAVTLSWKFFQTGQRFSDKRSSETALGVGRG